MQPEMLLGEKWSHASICKKGVGEMLKMTRGGYRMNTAIKFHLLSIHVLETLSHNYQKMCKFNTITKINVTENVIHCTSCANLHYVCINLRITILDSESDTNVNPMKWFLPQFQIVKSTKCTRWKSQNKMHHKDIGLTIRKIQLGLSGPTFSKIIIPSSSPYVNAHWLSSFTCL